MKSAEEMTKYIKDNDLGIVSRLEKSLKLIEKQLHTDEKVISCFAGLHNTSAKGSPEGQYAYAITNYRLIMAEKRFFSETVDVIPLNEINNVSLNKSKLMGNAIEFKTVNRVFNVGAISNWIDNIYNEVNAVIFGNNKPTNISDENRFNELKEYKELLDMEIITQEEFDKKKQEVLG